MKEAYEKDDDNYDFVIGLANYLYLWKDKYHNEYIEKARRIDKERTEKFLKKFQLEPKELFEGEFIVIILDCINYLMEKNEISEANNNLNFLLIHENLLDKEIIKMARGLQIECLFVENRLDEVNEKIARLLEIDDDNHHAHFYKSQLLFFSKNYDDALKSINKCLEKSEKIMPHPDFYMLKAMILKEQDNEEYIYYEEKSKELLKARDFIMEAMDDLKVDEDMFKN